MVHKSTIIIIFFYYFLQVQCIDQFQENRESKNHTSYNRITSTLVTEFSKTTDGTVNCTCSIFILVQCIPVRTTAHSIEYLWFFS